MKLLSCERTNFTKTHKHTQRRTKRRTDGRRDELTDEETEGRKEGGMEEGGQITEEGEEIGVKKRKERNRVREIGMEGREWQRGTMRGSPSICLKATACPVGREPECVHSGLNNGCS